MGAFVLLLSASGQAWAATYYVATTGSDSNSGSEAAPFKTFQRAIDPLQPGDTLYIRGGTYSEQMDFQDPSKSGREGAWIKIAGYPGETVTLTWRDPGPTSYGPIKARGNRGYFIFENLILDGVNSTNDTGWAIRDGNHHFTLRNLEIKNFKKTGLSIKEARDIQVINCKIHDQIPFNEARLYGMYITSYENILIEGNQIYNNPGGGITLFPGPLRNVIIRNNVIHHNNNMDSSNPGIQVFADIDYTSGGGTGAIDGVQIYNNIVYSNSVSSPRTSGGIWAGNGASNTKIWNNTVYGNKGYGILVSSDANGPARNTVVQNNIAFGNTTQQIIDAGSNTTLSNNLTTDPKFVNAGAGDFGLQAGSPALDKGISLAAVPKDFTGKARPEGAAYDLGAFEGAGSRADAFPAVGGGITPIDGAGSGSGGSDPLGLGNCSDYFK